MKVVKNPKFKYKFFIKLCVLGIIGFFVIKIVEQQININTKHKQCQQIQEKIQIQEAKNQKLREENQRNRDFGEDVKKTARKRLDFAERSEKVFVNS